MLGVTGVSLFSLGAMFNHLVSLFQKRLVQGGLFGKRIFDPPLETHFGTLGTIAVAVGVIAGGGTIDCSRSAEGRWSRCGYG